MLDLEQGKELNKLFQESDISILSSLKLLTLFNQEEEEWQAFKVDGITLRVFAKVGNC
jgi:hypothetical protein